MPSVKKKPAKKTARKSAKSRKQPGPDPKQQIPVQKAWTRFEKQYGAVRCPLNYNHPHELCIAVILSAQCTDAQVNKITPALFKEFPTPQSYYQSAIEHVEEFVKTTGFYHNKARNIRGFCRMLTEEYNGRVPDTLEELIKMPGVGRKTANVVIQELYGKPSGVVVDTHVSRISRVFGLTKEKDAVKIERDLMSILPKRMWMNWSLYMIHLGRSYCTARKRMCAECYLNDICPSSSLTISEK